jgi:hypothetical protein
LKLSRKAATARGVLQELGGRELLGRGAQVPTWPSSAVSLATTSVGPTTQPTRRPVAAKALLIPSTSTV